MARVTINVDWHASRTDDTMTAERRAVDMLKLYGFSLVSVQAHRRGMAITLALTGETRDVFKARSLFVN